MAAITEEFKEQVAEALQELGYSIENAQQDTIEQVSELDDDVTLPGIKYENGVMLSYVHMKLAVLKGYLDGTVAAIQSAWNTWFGSSINSGVQKTWSDWFTGRQSEWDVIKVDAQTATANANTATSNAQTATSEAENVDATVIGTTVTITDRNGTSHSVNIGFEIYRTYSSVAAMNADAANVPEGKFVIIATTDPTSEDNAKMYCKNSQGSFTFLCDLDQASSSAWADWLNNMKPVIEAATSAANTAATNANDKAAIAEQKGNAAETRGSTAESKGNAAETQGNYAKSEADRAKNLNDHPAYIGNDNYWYLWDYTTQEYVRGAYAKGDDLDYSTMTQQEIQQLIDNIKADLVFASVETCEDIIEELQ